MSAAINGHCAAFRSHGFSALPVLRQMELAHLRAHYRRLRASGAMRFGDGQSPRRWVIHNEAAARHLQARLVPLMARLASGPVQPSYTYSACYEQGADLPWHTDRPQCEYSISLCLDFEPEPADFTPWPLYLATREGIFPVWQRPGDGLFYRGRSLPHHRDTLARGCRASSIFLHYVDAGFRGPLD